MAKAKKLSIQQLERDLYRATLAVGVVILSQMLNNHLKKKKARARMGGEYGDYEEVK